MAMMCSSVRKAKPTHPTGDPNFTVMQPFPAAVDEFEADPFLMCDEIGPSISQGKSEDPDHFPVDWHPHYGMDVLSYITEGTGRHADSLGNRGEFASPGFQWMSVGSGVEHAEGGGTPAGERKHGFQIWVNVPGANKSDDPRYGTEPPENMVDIELPQGGLARVIAGELEGRRGPFRTVQSVQIIHFELPPGLTHRHVVPDSMGTCLVYIFRGDAVVSGEQVPTRHVAVLDASDRRAREVSIAAGTDGAAAIMFAGERIGEPIAWHGPFVAGNKTELRKIFSDFQRGMFPLKRVAWDYRRAAARPK